MERQTTVLFAEVTGSTRLYEQAGDTAAAEAIRSCLEAMRRATEACGGRVVKTIGDEVLALFPDPDRATQAATRMHLAVNALPPIRGQKLSLRIGFHAGSVLQRDGDVFGEAVNIASRLAAQANKGQVLTSADTATQLTPLQQGATRRLYDITVKGKTADVSLCEVLWSNSPDVTDNRLVHAQKPATNARLRLRLGSRELVWRRCVETISIGRDPQSTLVIADAAASRNHCVIERRQNHFVIRDYSTNGTYISVDGHADDVVLRREEYVLSPHGWITCGRPRKEAAEVAEYFCEEEARKRRGGSRPSRIERR
jgi:class 3 adenylate cyclase